MIFLIEYDRHEGKIVEIKPFDESRRSEAETARLQMELALSRKGLIREVVLLEAANYDALRRTHRRYFENIYELADYKFAALTLPSDV